MILVDANLLIWASMDGFDLHERAREWLDGRLRDVPGVGLPWPTLLAFARIVSNPRVFKNPMPIEAAWRQVEAWRSQTVVFAPEPTTRHAEVLATLMPHVGNRPNLLPDAHLAALAIEYRLTLCSADSDFARFPGLNWVNPLAA